VCVVRAAALGLQLSQTAECPNIPKLLALNILNYALWAFLFLMSYKFFQSGNGGALSAVNLACWANLVFKIIVTGLLGTASDLQGNCFLERGFKTWTWIVGGAEAVLFIFLLVRIHTGVTNFNKNK